MSALEDRTVLVTGGGGFIGSALADQVLDRDPGLLRVVDNDEQRLFGQQRRLDDRTAPTEFVLADLREESRVRDVVEDVDVVFHVAAIKHVGLSERHPTEAVKTNVSGTRNLVDAAIEDGVESFTAVSTDKASEPTSVMGSTKLIMERLVTAANTRCDPGQTFGCVRFGNVLGSSGSVVPIFLDQIRDGGPLTVTNPNMTRFIMSVDNAVELVLDAHDRTEPGRITVLKMPAFRVGDLAEGLRQRFAPKHGYCPDDVNVKIVGARPGESRHENLIASEEVDRTVEREDTYVIYPDIDVGADASSPVGRNALDGEYTSEEEAKLSPGELADLVEETVAGEQVVEA